MRKFNKLIPILPVVATTIVAPVVISSCHPQYVEPMEMHDLINGYTPQTEPMRYERYNQTQATAKYIYDVERNPQIFIDDACTAALNLVPDSGTVRFNFGVSKPKFGSTKISHYGGEDIEYSTITCDQKTIFEFIVEENNNTKTTLSIELDIWYKNVVFYAYENGADRGGGWNLGLFDYNVGEEAFWPFISNTNPWSISYGCKTKKLTYYTGNPDHDVLIDSKCSYYSGQVNNGTTLVNLVEYYNQLPDDPEPYSDEYLEKNVLSIILIDYTSRYLQNVDNVPEIMLSSVLSCSYEHSNNLRLDGLVLVCPSYIENPDDITIVIHNRNELVYSIGSDVEPLYQQNSVTIPNTPQYTPLDSSYLQPIPGAPYRYKLFLPGNLENLWGDVPPSPGAISLYFTTNNPTLSVGINYIDKDDEPRQQSQEINLKYNYLIHTIHVN